MHAPELRDIDAAWLRRFRSAVRRWSGRHGRELPWRGASDAYRVWISEIMLQQTTAAVVAPYYQRFLKRFPTLGVLAAADEQEVLRLWEGLGYYSRARNLHRTAKQIVQAHAGRFPDDLAALQGLPGIGRYTAGAIASFAFDRRAPIVEANTLRLYSRLLDFREDPRSAPGQRLLWTFAERILPQKNPGRFNQALIDLGATVCAPAAPQCETCPVRRCCRAFAAGTQREVPLPAKRARVTETLEAGVAVQKRGRFLLRRCGDGERWAGLWDFPRFELNGHAAILNGSGPMDQALRGFIGRRVRELTGVQADVEQVVTEVRHSVTRYRIRLVCYSARHRSGRLRSSGAMRWVAAEELASLPLSVTGRKLASILVSSLRGATSGTPQPAGETPVD